MPHLMKHMLENKMGILPYEVQKDIKHYGIRDRVSEIDERRIQLAQSSKKITKTMKAQLKDLEDEYDKQRFRLADNLERMDSMTTINVHAEKSNSSDEEEEEHTNLENFIGEQAKDKFWDFYKSERKFKDFNPEK